MFFCKLDGYNIDERCVCDKGMIALILETIDKCSQWKSMRHLAHLIGEDSAAKWNDMINYLYLLLGMSAVQSVGKKLGLHVIVIQV